MVSSPPGSPTPRLSSSQQGSGAQGGGQLLQELEALSQALYQAQRKGPPSQHTYQGQSHAAASPKKPHSFLPRRESLPGRHFPSYEPAKDVTYRPDPIPLPGLASHDPPMSFSNLLSRHSMSVPQVPVSREQPKPAPANSRIRFSSSTIPSQATTAWGEEKSDIRGRMERRLSLQPGQSKPLDKFTPEEPEWPEESPDIGRKVEPSSAEKKKSVWSWKPLRALSHIGRQRFHCVFSAYVHAIEGLPPAMNGLRLCVHMRKEETKDGAVQTMPSRVFQGIAEFQETLFMKCTLYGSKGPSNTTKFMAKSFIISVIAPDIDEMDFGKHQVDLSRLLSEFMEDRKPQPEKGSSWDTTLDLFGKAKGGKLIITFNYEVLDKDSANFGNASSRFSPPQRSSFHTSYSLPNSAHGTPRTVTARAHLNHSPTVSEPGNDYDDLVSMEHLNLDEPAPMAGLPEARGRQTSEVQGFPAIRSTSHLSPVPPQVPYKSFPSFEGKFKAFPQMDVGLPPPPTAQPLEKVDDAGSASQESEEGGGLSEDEAEFVVVDKGVEMDGLGDSPPKDDKAANMAIDTDKKNDKDDPPSEVVEDHEIEAFEEKKELEDVGELQHEPEQDKEVDIDEHPPSEEEHDAIDPVPRSIRLDTDPVEVPDSTRPETEPIECDNEKIVNVDEGEANETVTYLTVLQTLDSLLEGTSAKEQPQEVLLAEKLEVDAIVDKTVNKEEQQMMDVSSFDGLEEGAGSVGEEVEDVALVEGLKEGSGFFGKDMVHVSFVEGLKEDSGCTGQEVLDTDGPTNTEVNSSLCINERHTRKDENVDSDDDIVAGEFLHLLEMEGSTVSQQSDSEPDSPRARLLEQFEQEAALLQGGFRLDLESPEFLLENTSISGDTSIPSPGPVSKTVGFPHSVDLPPLNIDDEGFEHTSFLEAAEFELQRATQSLRSKTRAKMLEDAETEALMQEWGLDEKAFASSPPKPAFMQQQDPPPLAKGLGAAVPLKDGGVLRSMNPTHFQSTKSSGKLVMQMSKPLVVPAELGSDTVDILRNMASMGAENMALQVMTALPLEDISGRSIEQVAVEGPGAAKNGHTMETSLASKRDGRLGLSLNASNDFLSLEDLAPMAMQQIEALALDGLKIQSDMGEDDAPYALNALSMEGQQGENDFLAEAGMGMKGVSGVHLFKGTKLPAEASGAGNGLMDMAISLDEWMLLDAGLYDEVAMEKDTMAIMAAHHAVHQELVPMGDEDKSKKKHSSRRKGAGWGCMGNTLTIAMLVQLRDPLRNNEAIGAPMMAFVQAERMVKPPKPKVGRTVSFKGNTEDEQNDSQEEPQFKITGVHMAGIKAPQVDRKIGWASDRQQQTGSRWLIANGMSKNSRSHPLLTSKASSLSNAGKSKNESLWSISSRVQGSGNKWKDMVKTKPHVRNPDVVYENRTLRVK